MWTPPKWSNHFAIRWTNGPPEFSCHHWNSTLAFANGRLFLAYMFLALSWVLVILSWAKQQWNQKVDKAKQKGSYFQRAYGLIVNTLIKFLHKNIISNFWEKEHEVIEAYSRSSSGGKGQFFLKWYLNGDINCTLHELIKKNGRRVRELKELGSSNTAQENR